jgi:hypothetical protein
LLDAEDLRCGRVADELLLEVVDLAFATMILLLKKGSAASGSSA